MKYLILISMLSIAICSKADYGELNFKIIIHTVEGKESIGYSRTTKDLNTDSLDNTSYLIDFFAEHSDSIFIYLDRISYRNSSDQAPMNLTEHKLLTKKAIPSQSIREIKISELEIGSTLTGFANNLTLSDTSWIYSDPLRIIHVHANACEYDIFIHEENSELDSLLQEFKSVAKKHKNSEEDSPNLEEIKEHQELIRKMQGLKVVIINFCTC